MVQIGKVYKFKGAGNKLTSGCGARVGQNIEITSIGPTNPNGKTWRTQTNGWVFEHELEVEVTKETIKEDISKLKTEISEKETEIKNLEDKLELMEKHGLETIDDETIKVYSIMKEIGIDDIEKVKNIVKILNK